MMRIPKNVFFSLLYTVSGFAFLWIVWIAAYYGVKNEYLIPSVKAVFVSLGELSAEGEFWRSFGGTLLRAFLAFLSASVCGWGFAALALLFRGFRLFLSPLITVLRTLPTLVFVLLLLLWTSPSSAPVVVSFLVLFPAVYVSSLAAFSEAEAEYSDFAKAYRIGKAKTVFRLYLPVSAPSLLTEAGASFSLGLKITVSGEVLSATYYSLGGMMQDAQVYFETSRLFALTVMTVLLGFLIEGGFALLKRRFLRRVKQDRKI